MVNRAGLAKRMGMMATINAGDILRLVLTLNMPYGTVAQNIFAYTVISLSDPDSSNVANDFVARMLAIYAHVTPAMSDLIDGNTLEMYVRDTTNQEWTLVETDSMAALVGEASDEMLPHGVAGLVSALSVNNRTSGRKYLPGLTEGAQAEGQWTASTLSGIASYAAGYAGGFAGGAGAYAPGVWSETDQEFYAFQGGAVVNGIAAYQRRRKVGVGI
uniref:Uncharacterized protein n=1 Tax=uncultured prokaryote TaxID=198431 RepID=A0A0H5Q5C5_9ZZZZ|nr:hypothetical protein [uncultured prokaryote]